MRSPTAIAVFLLISASSPSGWAADAAGVVSSYDANALKDPGKTRARDWPAWRRSMKPLQWKSIAGTDLPPVVSGSDVPGHPRNIIDAWNGLAADRRTSRLYSAANGGHADYAGNGVYELDLSVDQPRWTVLRKSTARHDVLASDYTKKVYNNYYRDGRPASTHTYYSLQFIASRNAIFKFGAGSLWGTGNEANWKTDAFSLENADWQPAGTWPDVVPDSRRAVTSASVCIDPDTDEVYVGSPSRLRRFDPVSGKFDELAAWPDNSTAVSARACAVDTRRDRVVFFGDAYRVPNGGLLYERGSPRMKRISFDGEDLRDITSRVYNFAWYEPTLDRFLVKTRTAGDLYSVDPEKFSVERFVTEGGAAVPNARNGVQSRWQRLPALGGYAYYPRSGSGVWFLAIE